MKVFISIAAFIMFIGIALGAMGSHAFKPMLEEAGRLSTYQTATHYLLIHALAILFLNWGSKNWPGFNPMVTTLCFLGGILFFSGSLYAVSFGMVSMGMVAPVGGLAYMVGWLVLGFQVLVNKG